jgi:hypothetical protein
LQHPSQAANASVQVDASQPYGILITNGEFTAFCNSDWCDPAVGQQPSHVLVGPGNAGAVKFSSRFALCW